MVKKTAIIGAGNIARSAHIPALMKKGVNLGYLVDTNSKALLEVKNLIGYDVKLLENLANLANEDFDKAIICTPTALHFTQVLSLLEQNKHVLCEKPLAVTAEEAQILVDTAKKNNCILQVGFYRRFHPVTREIKEIINNQTFGVLKSCSIRAGHIFNSPPSSILDKKLSCGGITIDFGVHVLDRLFSWFTNLELVEYFDDAMGNIEVNANLKLNGILSDASKVPIDILFSWTNNIGYIYRLDFDCASVTGGLNTGNQFTVLNLNQPGARASKVSNCYDVVIEPTSDSLDYFVRQWEEFESRIAGGPEKVSNLETAIKVSGLIEEVYSHRNVLQLPWGF